MLASGVVVPQRHALRAAAFPACLVGEAIRAAVTDADRQFLQNHAHQHHPTSTSRAQRYPQCGSEDQLSHPATPSEQPAVNCERKAMGCDDDDRAGSDLAHFNAAGSTPRCWSLTYETCWAPCWSPTAAVSRKPARADGTGRWLANMTYSGCDWRTRPRGPSTQGASQR